MLPIPAQNCSKYHNGIKIEHFIDDKNFKF